MGSIATTLVGITLLLLCGGCSKGTPSASSSDPSATSSTSSSRPSAPVDGAGGSDLSSQQPTQHAVTGADGQEVVISVDPAPPKGHPSDFFPTSTGTTWTYSIEVGGVIPLLYEQTTWPMGTGEGHKSVAVSTRGVLRGSLERNHRRSDEPFRLELSVKGPAKRQGPYQYPEGVELSVGSDELGVFHDAKQIFWAIAEPDRYNAQLVMIHDPTSSGAPGGGGTGFGGWGRPDGYAVRFFYFVDRPGISLSLSESPDSLIFAGIDRHLRGYDGIECLRYVRIVKGAQRERDAERSELDRPFREEMWFARNKGLVRLIQTVEGKMSMRWTMVSFKQGRE